MKKSFEKLILLPVFSALFIFSCATSDDEEDEKPAITVNSSSISIPVPLDSDVDYVNILRKTTTDDTVYNIGEIIPVSSGTMSRTFTDSMILADTKYSYRIRYRKGSHYTYSGWSDWPVESDGETEVAPPTSGITDTGLSIDSTTYLSWDGEKILTVKGTTINSISADFYPCLVVKSGSTCRTVKIKDAEAAGSALLSEGDEINLKDKLPSTFLNTDLTISGIVLEKSESDSRTYEILYWSDTAAIGLKDSSDSEITKLNVKNSPTEDDSHDISVE